MARNFASKMVYYINIGSNSGNRLMNLTRAVSAVEKQFGWFELSHHIESEPWGFVSENKFLNVGMVFVSDLQPVEVLHKLQEIEKSISPASHRNADGSYRDRVIDIDIMIAEEVIPGDKNRGERPLVKSVKVNTDELNLPHPHLKEREFFLKPLSELIEIMAEKYRDYTE